MCILVEWPQKTWKTKTKLVVLASLDLDKWKFMLRVTWPWRTSSGVFRGAIGPCPLWPKKKILTIGKIWKTWFGPLCVSTRGQQKFGPLFEILNTPLRTSSLTNKVTCKVYSVDLCSFQLRDPEKLENKRNVVALASLEPENWRVIFRVTWPWLSRSPVKLTLLAYVFSSWETPIIWKSKQKSLF